MQTTAIQFQGKKLVISERAIARCARDRAFVWRNLAQVAQCALFGIGVFALQLDRGGALVGFRASSAGVDLL